MGKLLQISVLQEQTANFHFWAIEVFFPVTQGAPQKGAPVGAMKK